MRTFSRKAGFGVLVLAIGGLTPVLAQVELSPLSCNREASLRAVTEETPATIRIVNAASDAFTIYRLDGTGKRVLELTLPPMESVSRNTYVTHPWLVANAAGECRAIFLPEAGESTARIANFSIVLPTTGVIFTAVAGGPAPPPQTFPVVNGGAGVMGWSVSLPMMTGSMMRGWLNLRPPRGSSDAALPAPTVEASVDHMGLAPGEYCNLVEIAAPGAINSPLGFCVVLLVLPADADVAPLVEPGALVFSGARQAANPAPQTLKVYNLASRPMVLRSKATFAGAANWFDAQPSEATVRPGEPVTLTLRPDFSGLNPGAYRSELTLQFGTAGPATTISIQALVLAPAMATARGAAAGKRSAGSAPCTPTKLQPAFAVLGPDFNAQAGWPIPIEVLVYDDCAAPMETGSVVVSFSNNDPPLHLTPVLPGRWSGTWAARNARPSGMTILARAQQPERKVAGEAQISGRLQGAADVPLVAVGGVVSAVSFAGGPQGPGSYLTIFGERLSEGPGVATSLPLQNRLSGTEVFMSGRTVPLLFTSEGQVNAIVPFDLKVNARHQLIVRRGACMSVPEPLELMPARPAVFSVDGSGKGQGHIYRATSGGAILAQPGQAAAAGEILVLYASGLGQVEPLVDAGAAAPANALAKATVGVTIGGRNASVLYAGLTPGFAGLYQVNTVVPDGVTPGDAVPLVLTAAGQASPAVTIAVK